MDIYNFKTNTTAEGCTHYFISVILFYKKFLLETEYPNAPKLG